MKNYRGDTFFRNYEVRLDDEIYTFKEDDKINLVFHNTETDEDFLERTITAFIDKTSVDVVWTADEMKQLKVGSYILEAEIVTSDFTVTHQEILTINEDYIVGEEDA